MHHVAYFLDRLPWPRCRHHADAPAAAPDRVHPVDRASDAGEVPASALDAVLTAHQDLIDRIKICYGRERAVFEHDVLSVIHRYAALVHLLPATPDNYFAAPGGLLRLGLEVGFVSLQGTDAHLFCGRATMATRRHLAPRWRLAVFMAGLCSELGHAMARVQVTSSAAANWSPDAMPLAQWLAHHGVRHYRVTWRAPVVHPAGAERFALAHVIGADLLHDLAADNAHIMPPLLACLGGRAAARLPNVIADLVRRSAALVIERALHAEATQPAPPGAHWARYLVAALRDLVASHPAWRPNGPQSRCWFGDDGAFVSWPRAANDVRQYLDAMQWQGIPKDPEMILHILRAAGVIVSPPNGETLWHIYPPGEQTCLDAIRLASPELLFAGLVPMPHACPVDLCARPAPAAPAVVATPCAPVAPARQPPTEEPVPPPAARVPVDTILPARHTPAALNTVRHVATLAAPLRLPPHVRDVLAAIIAASQPNTDAATRADDTAGDLFIPLTAFAQRDLDPPTAWRALADANMLAPHTHQPTPVVMRDRHGKSEAGVLLQACFVRWHPVGVVGTMPDDGP